MRKRITAKDRNRLIKARDAYHKLTTIIEASPIDASKIKAYIFEGQTLKGKPK